MDVQPRILVVDDDQNMAKTLTDILRIKGYEAEQASSAQEALGKAEITRFDCMLSDIRMQGTNGVELYRAMRHRQPSMPAVLMTAYASEELTRQGLEAGVVGVLTKPLDIKHLLDFVSHVRHKRLVVLVDDNPAFCRSLRGVLQTRGFSVQTFHDPWKAMEEAGGDSGVVLLDIKLNGVLGTQLLQEIKSRLPGFSIVLLTGYREEMEKEIAAALETAAAACLFKPLEIDKVIQLLDDLYHQGLVHLLGVIEGF